MSADNVVDITYENAQRYLIDESSQRLVLIDFWADWCAPCKALMPLLEKIAGEYPRELLVARLNADQLQDIAAQFGVRSLPTVILMKDGRPVDAIQGAQPESALRQFLEPHLPAPWEGKRAQAAELMAAGDIAGAVALLREAWRESERAPEIALALAGALLEFRRPDEARTVLDSIPLRSQDETWRQLMARWELMQEAARSPAIRELEDKLNADPDNPELMFELAVQFSQEDHPREALELLYSVLEDNRDFRDGQARRVYLDILATLGKGDPLAVEFQRKIYTLLY